MLPRIPGWLVLSAAVLWLPCLLPPVDAAEETRIGQRIEEFQLHDIHGQVQSLAQLDDGARLTVVVFLGNDCPLARLYAPRLAALAKRFADDGVRVVGINSNRQDSITEIADFVRHYALPFPILKDRNNVVADQFGAQRNPEVFVLSDYRIVRYRGRIDDQYGIGYQRAEPKREDLRVAIEELLAGKPVSQPSTEVPGCIIGRVTTVEPRGDVTYANQISRILNRRCVECHRDGELAPFALQSYDEVVGWAETIREAIHDGRMPPWFADGRYGQFANDCSMTEEEKALIDQWVDNGCPEGNPADLPEPPDFVTGWRMGQPDAVYEMEEPYTVPAEGVVDYQHFVIDPGFTEDVWISAAEARPGNPAVVHHIVLFATSEAALRNNGRRGAFGPMVAIYAPGMPPWQYPQGTAMRVKAGTKFVVQMHYTTNGREQDDQSYVGVKFADAEQVEKQIRTGMALNAAIEIPPHADNHAIRSKSRFRRDTLLLSLFPHMHWRGKAFRVEANYPDGTSEVLLDVPRYDFNWQLRYDYASPKLLPKGTEMVCTGYFDNSADNLRNPDPEATVRFGLQSWEEMMVGYYTFVRADEDLTAEDEDE